MPHLFDPLRMRSLDFSHRILVSPMCQYSCRDGMAQDWHLVHLGSRAVGRAAAVLAEATAVTADGRISPVDLGLWNDGQAEPLGRIFSFIERQGAGLKPPAPKWLRSTPRTDICCIRFFRHSAISAPIDTAALSPTAFVWC